MNVFAQGDRMHELLGAPTDFASPAHLKKCALPSLSDFVYPVLLDCDPTSGVEDDYKKKKDLLFSWRLLK